MPRQFTHEEIARHDALFGEAFSLIRSEILVHGEMPQGAPGFFAKRKLKGAIERFKQVLEINPENWQAMWGMGKVYQRLGEHRSELDCFRRAHRLNPTEPSVNREATVAAMNLGQGREAVGFCRTALESEPDDAGLKANLALALTLAGEVDEGHAVAAEAVSEDPSDAISQAVLRAITEIQAGSRPRPRTLKELEASL